jgi:hypothetical protein
MNDKEWMLVEDYYDDGSNLNKESLFKTAWDKFNHTKIGKRFNHLETKNKIGACMVLGSLTLTVSGLVLATVGEQLSIVRDLEGLGGGGVALGAITLLAAHIEGNYSSNTSPSNPDIEN